MDHLYPQDLGGPTIPNNLAPTCSDCNSEKGNLTEKQYRNNYLLDGFLVLIFAKNNNLLRVPTIVLENVEVVFNKQ